MAEAKTTTNTKTKSNGRTRAHPEGEHLIEVLKKDYRKAKGSLSEQRWNLLLNAKQPMTVNAYIEACRKLGENQDKGAADIRWDRDPKRELIRLVAPKSGSSSKAA